MSAGPGSRGACQAGQAPPMHVPRAASMHHLCHACASSHAQAGEIESETAAILEMQGVRSADFKEEVGGLLLFVMAWSQTSSHI